MKGMDIEKPPPLLRRERPGNHNAGLGPHPKMPDSTKLRISQSTLGVRGKQAQTTRSVSCPPRPNFCGFLGPGKGNLHFRIWDFPVFLL